MATDFSPPADPALRPRPTLGGRLGIGLIGGCLAGMIALTALAARSYHVEEQLVAARSTGTFDEAKQFATAKSDHLKVESALGVVGLTWERRAWADHLVLPFDFEQARTQQATAGWSLRRETTTGSPRPFGRSRQSVGAWQTLRWEQGSGRNRVVPAGGPGLTDRWQLVVPYWLLVLPGFGPLAWWLSCPPGRAVPRLTIGRLGLLTAAVGLLLGGLNSFGRSSASDRALAVVGEFGGSWTYRSDPAGSGRAVVNRVEFVRTLGSQIITDADMPRIKAALDAFPDLEALEIDAHATKLTAAGIALIQDNLNLPTVKLAALPVDDAMLRHLRSSTRLRHLNIAWTNVTDAGLADLAHLPELDTLCLNDPAITDAGIMQLARLPQLRTLYLTSAGRGGQVSEAAARQLFDSISTLEWIVTTGNHLLGQAEIVKRQSLKRW